MSKRRPSTSSRTIDGPVSMLDGDGSPPRIWWGNQRKLPVHVLIRAAGTWALAVVMFVMTGCQHRGYTVVPVAGQITLNGEPLRQASITTQPIAQGDNTTPGPGSWGKSDDEGRFVLELVDPVEKGAVVGEHRVMVTTAGHSAKPQSDLAQDVTRDNLPPQCRDGSLRCTIPPNGTDTLLIELRFPARR